MSDPDGILPTAKSHHVLDAQVIEVFADAVRVLGLPRSLGEIYGLLFISHDSLALDDFVNRLGISKGSASQGLRTLRELGAVEEVDGQAGRRTYYRPEVNLKRLVGGFIREQVRPHVASGESKIDRLVTAAGEIDDLEERKFYQERTERLRTWMSRARVVLPMLQRILGE